jgi:hypothetical protein
MSCWSFPMSLEVEERDGVFTASGVLTGVGVAELLVAEAGPVSVVFNVPGGEDPARRGTSRPHSRLRPLRFPLASASAPSARAWLTAGRTGPRPPRSVAATNTAFHAVRGQNDDVYVVTR